jgi:hypothetical protein
MKLVVETLNPENNLQTMFGDDMNILLDVGAQVVDKVLDYYMGLTLNDYVRSIMEKRKYATPSDKVNFRVKVLLKMIDDKNTE